MIRNIRVWAAVAFNDGSTTTSISAVISPMGTQKGGGFSETTPKLLTIRNPQKIV